MATGRFGKEALMAKKKTTPRKRTTTARRTSGDTITVTDISGSAAVAVGREASATVQTTTTSQVVTTFNEWRAQIEQKIDALPNLTPDDKQDLKQQADKIQAEAAKGKQADPSRLEKLLNTLAVMSQDIFEVAITTLANPLLGIGLVAKKISDRAKVERKSQPA
jgi:HD-GYP domain-containing protein (c-di-GMP phosphodiesterase class II)